MLFDRCVNEITNGDIMNIERKVIQALGSVYLKALDQELLVNTGVEQGIDQKY